MNRAQRRKDAGINKRGLHKPKEGRYLLLVYGTQKWAHYTQRVPMKDGSFRTIKHTHLINKI